MRCWLAAAALLLPGCALSDWVVRERMTDTQYRREIGPRLLDSYRRSMKAPVPRRLLPPPWLDVG